MTQLFRLPHALSVAIIPILVASGLACGGGGSIDPIAPQEVAVFDTLTVPLTASGASSSNTWGFVAPDLPGFEAAATIGGTGGSGFFRYSPLASHVGTHEIEIQLLAGSSVVDSRNLVVTVTAASDAAPVFLRPGAGRTFDLERENTVSFDVEVRDDDSSDVMISVRGSLPDGARLDSTGPKQAEFQWIPEPDQAAANERWTIALEADDGDHEPTLHNFVIVLRSGSKDDCPGAEPTISVLSPSEGARVENRGGYAVEANVSDDMGLRDPPLLYYSTSAPDDPEKPDITEFEQVSFSDEGGRFLARVPNLGLDEGEEQQVFFLVSATDNDDPSGTLCDHRVDSALFSFVALGGMSSGGLATCDHCTTNADCDSGICASSASGARCIPSCAGGASCVEGACGSRTTTGGGIAQGCGPVSDLCGGPGPSGSCTDDMYEENDSASAAATAPDSFSAQICSSDDDYYRITGSTGTDITVTVDGFVSSEGDLDLQLRSSSGTILRSSAGVTNSESVSYCLPTAGEVYARVYGYLGSENHYSMRVSRAAGSCCTDDAGEPDDTRSTARSLPTDNSFDGTICPGDDDYVSFSVSSPTGISITMTFDDSMGDLDLELYGPTGTLVGSSRGTTDIETIEMDLFETGTYTIRTYGFGTGFGDYLGEVRFTSFSGCVRSSECSSGEVCESGSCRSDACTFDTDCPTGHICPAPGPSAAVSHCGEECRVNSECKSTEACKWFAEGRYCGARGSGQNGEACSDFGDCGGQRACLDWPGGYCARAGCTRDADCETGTYCVNEGGDNVCAVDCWSADEICRLSEGYRCGVKTDVDSFLQFVCIPG